MKRPKIQLTLLLVLGLTFLALSPSLLNSFVNWDDGTNLLNNTVIRSCSLNSLAAILRGTVMKIYMPLTLLSYMVEYRLCGYLPFLYHLTNLLLHLAVTALVFLLGRQLGFCRRAALLAALLFGIHPVHVEAVAWVSARKDVLYSVFYLLAFWAYVRYRQKGSRYYYLSLLSALLSILAKPMALSLPLILLLVDWYQRRRPSLRLFADKFPYLLLIIPFTLRTYLHFARVPGDGPVPALLTWLWCLAFYVRKFFFPFPLLPLYTLPQPVQWDNPEYLLAILVTCGIIFFLFQKGRRELKFALGYYVLSVFFLLRFDDALDVTIVADRFLYLPSLGLCLWAGAALARGLEAPRSQARTVRALAVVIFAVLFSVTFFQTRVWQDSLALWGHNIRFAPRSSRAYFNRGLAHIQQKDYKNGMADLEAAVRYKETVSPRARVNPQNKFTRGIADLTERLRQDPHDAGLFLQRGLLYAQDSRHDLAIRDFDTALALDPGLLAALENRGISCVHQGDGICALANFNAVLLRNPGNRSALFNRAVLLMNNGDLSDAVADLTAVLQRDQNNTAAWTARGEAYERLGDYLSAFADFQQALRLRPADRLARVKIAGLYQTAGEPLVALEVYAAAISLSPEDHDLYSRRAEVYLSLRQCPEALKDAAAAWYLFPPDGAEQWHRMLAACQGTQD